MGLILTRLSGSNPSRQVIRGGGSTSTSGNHQDPQNLRSPDSCPPPKIHFPHPSFSPSPLLLLSGQATIILTFSPLPTVLRPKQNRLLQKHMHPCIFVYLDSCFHNWETKESESPQHRSLCWGKGWVSFHVAEDSEKGALSILAEQRRVHKTTTYYLQNGNLNIYI